MNTVWFQAIVVGSVLNFLMFFSLTTLNRNVIIERPSLLLVEFQAWQEPKKTERKPLKKQQEPKPKPKKRVVKRASPQVPKSQEEVKPPSIAKVAVAELKEVENRKEVLPQPVPIFEVSSLPRFVHRETPVYPPTMKQKGKEGKVQVEVLVDRHGIVRKVEVVRSAGDLFDQAAIYAIEHSTFIPAHANGKPVPVLLRLPIRFRMR
ncbi:MAG: TonB family protein [Mariprofundaceae bacterium]